MQFVHFKRNHTEQHNEKKAKFFRRVEKEHFHTKKIVEKGMNFQALKMNCPSTECKYFIFVWLAASLHESKFSLQFRGN